MREDMFKVIVERPRLVRSNAYKSDGRQFRNDEENGTRLGIKKGYVYSKGLNENLAPLRRFLEKQVNRPWDKVYAEIREQIDPRSTVKQHILQHLEDFVAINTHWQEIDDGKAGGEVLVTQRWQVQLPLAESRFKLFVHPRTGILLRNRRYKKYQPSPFQLQQQATQQQATVNTRVLDKDTHLVCVEDIWYCVSWQDFPAPRKVDDGSRYEYDLCWDVLKKAWVSSRDDLRRYASSKRQLNSKELAAYQLQAKKQSAQQNKK